LRVANSGLGKIIVNSQGRTLYMFSADSSTKSACTGACVTAWPPLTTTGAPTAGTGASASLIGTIKRSDGTSQVTYNGHPLYTFIKDQKAGDTNGQGVTAFGGNWSVVSPAGSEGSGSSPGSGTPVPPTTSKAQPAQPASVSVGNTSLGKVLVDAKGRTIYLFTHDSGTTSNCAGACATFWPPVTVTGTPTAGSGANAALIGTTKRSDGTSQVTYNGHPLYLYGGDSQAGDANGQGIVAFGGSWFVVAPSGSQIG
jgi:predicted lipoprotein with Yx(FWY)xxD motif